MSTWISWMVTAGVVVILELFTGTFYLLMISIGLVAGGLVALLGTSEEVQYIAAAIVGVAATLALHRSKYGWKKNVEASQDPNVNMDIGQSISVKEWQDNGNGKFTARAMYRGALWDVELSAPAAGAGVFTIVEVQGSRLVVKG
ncbi:NfeD family protein [Undibacterium sp.]|jgi:membrane protein implicated in regulation of membrane protease activity|uniref:NfeD family protein n=1 Tax=Undibacterium sp. TaxID=1914977 RepID=UPI002BC090B0|nr:NfeD family protein [Undibacterium sp.]HTD05498.1 NfeD family protein [Undibacterium sp.]